MSEKENLNKDAENVRELLKVAKSITKDVFGEDTTFNDTVTVYSLLKTERITRLAKEFAKLGRGAAPPGVELIPLGQLGPFGGNGGVS